MNTEQEEQEQDLFDFGGQDTFDFDITGFDIDFFEEEDERLKERILKPRVVGIKSSCIKYANAKKLAKQIDLRENSRYDVIVSGSFIFGDFIEALMVEHKIQAQQMTISTLSMSQENVESLRTLLEKGYVNELNLIVSCYFYAHERRKLVPYIYDRLDIDNRFQFACAGTHTKTVQILTAGGKKICIHGSANLRSSGCMEQFVVEVKEDLYDFHQGFCDKILKEYKTIDKYDKLRGETLWNVIDKKDFDD